MSAWSTTEICLAAVWKITPKKKENKTSKTSLREIFLLERRICSVFEGVRPSSSSSSAWPLELQTERSHDHLPLNQIRISRGPQEFEVGRKRSCSQLKGQGTQIFERGLNEEPGSSSRARGRLERARILQAGRQLHQAFLRLQPVSRHLLKRDGTIESTTPQPNGRLVARSPHGSLLTAPLTGSGGVLRPPTRGSCGRSAEEWSEDTAAEEKVSPLPVIWTF